MRTCVLVLAILVSSLLPGATPAQAASCFDGDPHYLIKMSDIAERLQSDATSHLSMVEMVFFTDGLIDELVDLTPPTAMREFHLQAIGLIHTLSLAAMAASYGDPNTAQIYLEKFEGDFATWKYTIENLDCSLSLNTSSL